MNKLIIIFIILLNMLIANNTTLINSTSSYVGNNTNNKMAYTELSLKRTIDKILTEKNNKAIGFTINLLTMLFTGFMVVLAIYGIFIEYRKFKDRSYIENMVDKEVNMKYKELVSDIKSKYDEIEANFNQSIKDNINIKIKNFHVELKKKENIKNNVLYNLNKWLQDKIKEENEADAYSWYNERFFIVNKLIYGDKDDIKRVLVELQGSASRDLLKLPSFKKLLGEISKEDIELDTLVQKLIY